MASRPLPWSVTSVAWLLVGGGVVAMCVGAVLVVIVAGNINDDAWIASPGFDILDAVGFAFAGGIMLAGYAAVHVARMLRRRDRQALWVVVAVAGLFAAWCAGSLLVYWNDADTRALDAQYGGAAERVVPPLLGLALGAAICFALARPSVRRAFDERFTDGAP